MKKLRYLINNETKKRLELPVRSFLITKNFWEYFIFDDPAIEPNEDIQFALVMGFETELGNISMSELAPYVAAKSNDLSDVMPPEGYSWQD